MVKRSADWPPEVPIKDLLSKELFVALPVPGPMTPSSTPSSSCFVDEPVLITVDESVLVADVDMSVSVDDRLAFPVMEHKEKSPKKIKTRRDRSMELPLPQGRDSQVSTAASTPVATPASSPKLRQAAVEPQGDSAPSADYCLLSVQELREELGLAGTELAVGWDKAELVGVLEYLDHMCLCAPDDPPAMEL